MNSRRNKLAQYMALQASAAAISTEHEITELQTFPLREPVSRRAFTVLRVRTKSGLTGWGECVRVHPDDLETARKAVAGRPATAWAAISTNTPLDGGIDMALLDITAKSCATPVYRLLGGATRFKARALAKLQGRNTAEVEASSKEALKAGYRALQVPLPPVGARNQGQAFDRAVRERMEALRSSAGAGTDFVLDGGGTLMAGDAASVAASLELFHPLWFDEPCPATNLRTIRKISEESVTPIGFGRDVAEASIFQDLLREGLSDVLRPDLHRTGISGIRRIATLAETYYVAVAPNHEGGPIATAAALHLAACLPNFFIQHIPWSPHEEDRRMRSDLVSGAIETVRDGFAAIPKGPGLGVEVSEAALAKYREAA